MLRSCYRTKFRFTPGGPLVPVRYYFAPKAPFLSVPCSFNVDNWDSDLSTRPVGDQRRRSTQGGNDWVDGSGPKGKCCDEPFGTPQAWLQGGDGQPTRLSCGWVTPPVGVSQRLVPASILTNPTYAPSGVSQRLVPATTVENRIYVATGVSQRLVPASIVTNPVHISTGVSQRLVPASILTTPTYVPSGVSQRLVPASAALVGPNPLTGVSQRLVPDSPFATGPYLSSGVSQRLVPASVLVPSNPLVYSCGPCTSSGMYSLWNLTVSGISGVSGCAAFNGTFNLTKVTGQCQWSSTGIFPLGGVAGFLMFTNNGVNWALYAFDAGGGLAAAYTIGTFNCLSANVFAQSFTLECSGWPSSITVSPS